jgi:hypothetical protein
MSVALLAARFIPNRNTVRLCFLTGRMCRGRRECIAEPRAASASLVVKGDRDQELHSFNCLALAAYRQPGGSGLARLTRRDRFSTVTKLYKWVSVYVRLP